MATVTLEPLARADVARAMHLELGWDQADFVGTIEMMTATADAKQDFHIILRETRVVGFFKLDRGYPEGYPFAEPGDLGVRGVLVDRRMQGQGIGAAAMALLPDYARARYPDAHTLVLTVDCRNLRAQRAYERAGFRHENRLHLGGRSGPELIMRFSLLEGRPRADGRARL